MKVKAIARISGRAGSRNIGDEFTVDAEHGAELIERKLVEAVEPVQAATAKPAKPVRKKP